MNIAPSSPVVTSNTSRPPAKNYQLEALRGIAALVVVWGHVVLFAPKFTGFNPTGFVAYVAPGHFSVLIFFVLSGYVIGLTNANGLKKADVRGYLRKRFVRLYPIYVISLLAALAVAGFAYPFRTVLIHFLFGQEIFAPIFLEDTPMWSLQYEVLYYLLFIPLSLWGVRPAVAVIGAAGIGWLLPFVLGTSGWFTSSYFFGFSFWALGWWLAAVAKHTKPTAVSSGRLLSTLLLLLSIAHLNTLETVASKLLKWVGQYHPAFQLSSWHHAAITPVDWGAVPYALIFILRFIGIDSPLLRKVSLVLQLLPIYGLLYVVRHYPADETDTFVLPTLFYLASTALYFLHNASLDRLAQWSIAKIIPLGAISYGLYAIHFPILALFQRIPMWTGTGWAFGLRTLIAVSLSFIVAYWLEKQFQPFFNRQLGKRV
jgi:peptidoglycan/LPS O-acetylase OafA/YrhL